MSSMLKEARGFKSALQENYHEVLREDAEATVELSMVIDEL